MTNLTYVGSTNDNLKFSTAGVVRAFLSATQWNVTGNLVAGGSVSGVAGTFSGAISGTTGTFLTADNSVTLTLKSTDADANVGPQLMLYRASASPKKAGKKKLKIYKSFNAI